MDYLVIKKLKDHQYAQCHVETDGKWYYLYSYNTLVLAIKYNREEKIATVTRTGLYSMTTRKHISWFLKEYFPFISYAEIRDRCEDNKLYCFIGEMEGVE